MHHTKRFERSALALAALLAMAALATLVFYARPANAAGQPQLVLSCTIPPPESHSPNGCGFQPANQPPIAVGADGVPYFVAGFWIWCQSATGSGTPYGPGCAGGAYFVNLNTNTYVASSISGSDFAWGQYIVVNFTAAKVGVTCYLFVPPTSGQESVPYACGSFPGSVPSTVFTNVLVRVT